MVQRGFDHGFRRRPAELLQDMLFHRTGVDPDADRDAALFRGLHDRVYAVRAADIAGIKPYLIHARFDRCQRKPVVEMDIRHDRYGRGGADRFERFRGLCIRHGAAHDIAACFGQRADLGQRRLRVPRVRVGHGLDRNGRAAADPHVAEPDLLCLFHIPSFPLPVAANGGPPAYLPETMRKISCPVT